MQDPIDELLRRAQERWSHTGPGSSPRPRLPVAVVACMDARVEMGRLLGLEPGDAHVIRNAGGVVTADVIRSIAVSQAVLGTEAVMIVMHTGCGMHVPSESVLRERLLSAGVAPPEGPLGTFPDLEAELRRGCARVRESEALVHRGTVRGFVYDVDDGALRELDV